jgi:3-hydroxyisobutyrate dehydrogenase-like beta-hydroxyacid dehydrogenase
MAINIAKAGFDLMVYDFAPRADARIDRAGAKAARSADKIGASLEKSSK